MGHRDHDHRAGRFHQGTNHFVHSGAPADTARAAEYETGPYAGWTNWTPFTYPFNLTRHPAAALPIGFADGMPASLQLIGPAYREDKVLQASRAIEAVHMSSGDVRWRSSR